MLSAPSLLDDLWACFPLVPGVEASGMVENTGGSVADLREGDEVYVSSGGCYVEYVAAPAEKVARKPASLSFEEAAGALVAAPKRSAGTVPQRSARGLTNL